MQRHQLRRRAFIADWRCGGIAARAARSSAQTGADSITVIQPERINTHGSRKRYEARIRCADDIVGRGSWCECHKLNCKIGRSCFAVHLRAAVLHSRQSVALHRRDTRLAKQNFAPPAAPVAIGGHKPTSRAFIGGFGAHWGAADLRTHLYHPTPAVQLFTVLRGDSRSP